MQSLADVPRKMIGNPDGLVIVCREEIGAPGWIVRVLNFATWKHLKYSYATQAEAEREFLKWSI